MNPPSNHPAHIPAILRVLLLKLLAATLLAGCATGCLVIPTPEFDSGDARANINKQTPRQFEAAKTTRTEVVLALGEPDAVSPDELKLAYRSEKICGFWFVGGYGNSAAGTIEKDRYLVAEFDALGVLQKLERSSCWFGTADPEKKLVTAATTNQDPAIRIQTRANWLAGVDGYQSKRATERMGLPGKLSLTDTELRFVSICQFANTEPVLTLPLDAIAGVTVDKYIFGRRLVIRAKTGETNSFEIFGPKGVSQNRQALQAVAEFIQKKINPCAVAHEISSLIIQPFGFITELSREKT